MGRILTGYAYCGDVRVGMLSCWSSDAEKSVTSRSNASATYLDSTQVVLSTISATGKMARVVGNRVHTILVDEAGCVEEIAMTSLLKLHPKNVVLIGTFPQATCVPGVQRRSYPRVSYVNDDTDVSRREFAA